MAITICPHCATMGRVPDTFVGRRVRCPKCQNPFTVEAGPPPATQAPAPSPVRARPPSAGGTQAPAPSPVRPRTPPPAAPVPAPRPAKAARPPAPPPVVEDDLEVTEDEVPAESDEDLVDVAAEEDDEPAEVDDGAGAPAEGGRVDYLGAYKYIFRNPRWFSNVLLFAVCCLIPVVGGITAGGYAYDVLASLIRGRRRTYPDFEFGRFGDYLGRGIWPFLISLIFVFPVALLLNVLFFALRMAMPRVMVNLSPLTSLVYMLTIMALSFLLMPLLLRSGAARSLDLGGGFGFAVDFFKRVGLQALLVYLFMAVTSALVVMAGLVLCCVGALGSFAVVSLAQVYLYNELYQLYLARGGEPIPVRK